MTADHAEYADFFSCIPRGPRLSFRAAARPGRTASGDRFDLRFLSMQSTSPNKIAAPNRRLRLGPVPWSFAALTSQDSAVGELYRWAKTVRLWREPCQQFHEDATGNPRSAWSLARPRAFAPTGTAHWPGGLRADSYRVARCDSDHRPAGRFTAPKPGAGQSHRPVRGLQAQPAATGDKFADVSLGKPLLPGEQPK